MDARGLRRGAGSRLDPPMDELDGSSKMDQSVFFTAPSDDAAAGATNPNPNPKPTTVAEVAWETWRENQLRSIGAPWRPADTAGGAAAPASTPPSGWRWDGDWADGGSGWSHLDAGRWSARRTRAMPRGGGGRGGDDASVAFAARATTAAAAGPAAATLEDVGWWPSLDSRGGSGGGGGGGGGGARARRCWRRRRRRGAVQGAVLLWPSFVRAFAGAPPPASPRLPGPPLRRLRRRRDARLQLVTPSASRCAATAPRA